MKYSVNDQELDTIRAAALSDIVTAESASASCTWSSIVPTYTKRKEKYSLMNIYTFAAFGMNKKPVIPQFFGFHNMPTWPLDETYSKWILILYKP